METNSSILTFPQLISNNLSSKQIVSLLNQLINCAIEPLFNNSILARELILQALLQTQTDHRRKISIHNKAITTSCITYGIIHKDFNVIKMCELDRNILFKVVLYMEPYLREALKLEYQLARKDKQSTRLKLHNISVATGIKNNLLTVIARWCLPYLNTYLQFKERIVAKYIKYAYREATIATYNTKLFIDPKELFKNLLLAIDKAIDKFDANRGTLTSYINQWMMSAKSAPEFNHQYNVSYDLPANVRKLMEKSGISLTNMSTTINEMHHEIEDLDLSDKMSSIGGKDKTFLRCLREIKGIKVTYLALDIPIILTDQEVTNLKGIQ